jgi:hypothetical protein
MSPGTASAATASASLPLPPGFFEAHRRTRLSEELRRQYVEFAEASLRKVFALSDSHKNSWIPLREKKGVAVFRNFGALRGAKAHKSNVAEVAGKGELAGSLAEVGRAYAAHDSARFQRLVKKLHPSGGGMLDAAVLFTVVPCAAATPFRYIGVKWFALKTPTPLVAHRDYCCLEVTDKMVDSLGNEMFVRVLSSIDVGDACPSLENSHGLVRAKMLAGFMYRADRAEPGVVRVHHVLRFDPGGYFPAQWAFKLAESQLVTGVVQLRRLVDKQQMTACTFVDRAHWVPNDQRRHCVVCARAFGTFRPRHHCRACGEVICGKCSVLKRVDVPGTTLRNVRICSVCNMTVQHGGAAASRPPAVAAAGGLAGLVSAQDPLGRSRMSSSQVSDTTSDNSTSSFTSSSTVAQNEMNLMDLYMGADAPDTPSASSDTSTSSNLSIRSTTSTQSSYDARGRNLRGHSGGRGGGGGGGFGFFPEASNTPRSYIANNLTPHSGKGFGSGPVTPSSDASSTTPSHRMESLQQHVPLDLGYLRDTVKFGDDGDNQAEDGSSINQSPPPGAEGEGAAEPTTNTPDADSSSSSGADPALTEKTPSLGISDQQPSQPDVGSAEEEEEKAASPLESKSVEPQVDARASSASAGKEEGESDARRHRARPSDGSSSSRQLASRALARLSSSRDDVSRASLSGSARKSLFGGLFSSRGRSSSVDLPRSSMA